MYEDAFCVSPNAWGGVLNKDTIPSIRAKVVCGACNNQLQFASDAQLLKQVSDSFLMVFVRFCVLVFMIMGAGLLQLANQRGCH
jgi:hypothetical protein